MARVVMRALAIDGIILASWLASAGLVVLQERGALWGGSGNPTASLEAPLETKEQWFGIYYQGQKIGFSQVTLVPEERDGVPGVGIIDVGRLTFTLLGAPQQLEVRAKAFIDADWRLQDFTARIQSSTYRLEWSGRRQGDTLLVTVGTPTSSVTKRLHDPTGSAFVSGLSSWAAFHRLHIGQSGKAWVLNPLALAPETVSFTVRRQEIVDDTVTLVVDTEVSGLTTTSWVTPSGEVLRETSPLGWEVHRETQAQALQGLARERPTLDLLSAASVPLDRPLEEPTRIERLTLLVEGIEGGAISIDRPGQHALPPARLADYHQTAPQGVAWCLLQLDRPTRPQHAAPMPEAIRRYLRPSPFVQSHDSRIASQAAAIIGGVREPWERLERIHRWVFNTLSKRLTIGMPSAIDVLATLSGDCHEHTVLFTALARSAGLPTRMVAGLVYQQGRLYYHAWPEVWLGAWVPTDPTLGQLIADATHLGLTEAEGEHLITLGRFLGKLRVSVLQVR